MSLTAIMLCALAQCGPQGCFQQPLYAPPTTFYAPPQMQFVLPQETPLRTAPMIIQQTPPPIYREAPRQHLPLPGKQAEPTPTPQSPPVSAGPLPVPPERDWGWHVVEYDGMAFPVWGYHIDSHTVHWNRSYPANKDQIARARSLFHPEFREEPMKHVQARKEN